MFILLTAPFFTSFEARMFIWRSILGRTGLVNSLLIGSGLISTPIDALLFTRGRWSSVSPPATSRSWSFRS